MRNLDETWRLCKSMWRWIAEHIDEFDSVDRAKSAWLDGHKSTYEIRPIENCFFCDYVGGGCGEECPGKQVDPHFDCYNSDYRHSRKPREFYNKIRRMDYARKRDMVRKRDMK